MSTIESRAQQALSYLALGDSYTIGESLPLKDNFPYQTVELLKQKGIQISEPVIVAKTGWTTDELMTAIEMQQLKGQFYFVSLLIGVNNQYRGRDIENYQKEFEQLLQKAIAFAGGTTNHVFVLSIPDWGATPFAEGRDRLKIANEIDQFNSVNKKISERFKVNYIEITAGTREASKDPSLVAEDKLHPSKKEYARWAEKLSQAIEL
ncbi:MAG: SGNH/GDSL hydrolase family protein [Chitinophagaceae bacterium]